MGARAGARVRADRRASARARRPAIPELARTEPRLARRPLRGRAPPLPACASARAPDDLAETMLCARAETATGLYPEARQRLETAAAAAPRRSSAARRAHAPLRSDRRSRRLEAARRRQLRRLERRAGRSDQAGRSEGDRHRGPPRRKLEGRQRRPARRRARRSQGGRRQPRLGDVAAREAQRRRRRDLVPRGARRSIPTTPTRTSGSARAALDDRYDAPAARDQIARALAVNPAHAGALALRAELALDAEDFAGGARRRGGHPPHQPARSGRRPRRGRRGLPARRSRGVRARPRRSISAVHPHDGGFFAFVAEALSRQRRYEEARLVAADGVAADPDDAGCLSVLATTLLRLGDETAGLETLRRAWKRDPYNLRTYNLLDLYEKVIPARYVTVASAHLRFRVEPAARTAITEVVAPFLEERYRADVARYGFEPKGPITFELYGDPRHFAVRTVGLPAIGVSGVCFGRIITSQAPTNHAFNWGMVLTHELAHVFAIELSRQRVPRWFTEGLSEVETGAGAARVDPARRRPALRRLEAGRFAVAGRSVERLRQRAQRRRRHPRLCPGGAGGRFSRAAVRLRGDPEGARRLWTGRARRRRCWRRSPGCRPRRSTPPFAPTSAQKLGRYDAQYLPTESLRGPPAAAARRRARRGRARDRRARRPAISTAPAARSSGRAPSPPRRSTTRPTRCSWPARSRSPAATPTPRSPRFGACSASDPHRATATTSRSGWGWPRSTARISLAAEAHLRRAVDFVPTRVEPRALLAELYGDQQREPDRLAALEAALRLDPMNDAVAKEVVVAEARAGHPARVVELRRRSPSSSTPPTPICTRR